MIPILHLEKSSAERFTPHRALMDRPSITDDEEVYEGQRSPCKNLR
jgi:hypothetical protein